MSAKPEKPNTDYLDGVSKVNIETPGYESKLSLTFALINEIMDICIQTVAPMLAIRSIRITRLNLALSV
jgi:hypothetical protein